MQPFHIFECFQYVHNMFGLSMGFPWSSKRLSFLLFFFSLFLGKVPMTIYELAMRITMTIFIAGEHSDSFFFSRSTINTFVLSQNWWLLFTSTFILFEQTHIVYVISSIKLIVREQKRKRRKKKTMEKRAARMNLWLNGTLLFGKATLSLEIRFSFKFVSKNWTLSVGNYSSFPDFSFILLDYSA